MAQTAELKKKTIVMLIISEPDIFSALDVSIINTV